jgi:hypothetical protein
MSVSNARDWQEPDRSRSERVPLWAIGVTVAHWRSFGHELPTLLSHSLVSGSPGNDARTSRCEIENGLRKKTTHKEFMR